MSGMFTGCNDCCPVPQCFSVTRRIGGFAEYEITHDTTNPVTYFVGRRYKQAQYELAFTQTYSIQCTVGSLAVEQAWGCLNNYTFTVTSNFSELVNIPTHSSGGAACGLVSAGVSKPFWDAFAGDGYYSFITDGSIGMFGEPYGSFGTPLDVDGVSSDSCSGLAANVEFLYPRSLSTSCTFPGGTDTYRFVGTGLAITSTVSAATFTDFATCDCEWHHDTMSVSDWYVQKSPFTLTGTGTLSSEVDYNDVIDSVMSAVTGVKTFPKPLPKHWGFIDYPIQDNDWTVDPATIVNLGDNVSGNGLIFDYVNDFCITNNSEVTTSNPTAVLGHHYFSSSWFEIGLSDTPGVDPWDTFFCTISMMAPALTTPYILVQYIVMNDKSLVLDTYGAEGPSCIDGVLTGDLWIGQPSAKNLPASLCSVSGGGALVGPVGRMLVLITGTTCATWDGVTPT